MKKFEYSSISIQVVLQFSPGGHIFRAKVNSVLPNQRYDEARYNEDRLQTNGRDIHDMKTTASGYIASVYYWLSNTLNFIQMSSS